MDPMAMHDVGEGQIAKERKADDPNNGHWCFGCGALVDHHKTGDFVRPIEVRDRGTEKKHWCIEMERFRGRRMR